MRGTTNEHLGENNILALARMRVRWTRDETSDTSVWPDVGRFFLRWSCAARPRSTLRRTNNSIWQRPARQTAMLMWLSTEARRVAAGLEGSVVASKIKESHDKHWGGAAKAT